MDSLNLLLKKVKVNSLLFDLDGTLLDTMDIHFKAYQRVIAQYGGSLSIKDFQSAVGPKAEQTIPSLIKLSGMPSNNCDWKVIHNNKKKVFKDLISTTSPRLLACSKILKQNYLNYNTAVVTSGNSSGANFLLNSSQLFKYIDVIITGDDVINSKPHPEPYVKCINKLGVKSYEALAFEDTKAGIESALAAQIKVIDVVNIQLMLP